MSEPFYQDENVTLYCGDWRDIVPTLDVRADIVLDDPPYGINNKSTHNSHRKGEFAKWVRDENFAGIVGDDEPFDPRPLLTLAPKVLMYGGNYFASRLPDSRCWVTWNKRDGIGPNDFADCEYVWTNLDRPSRIFDHLWSGLLRAGEENVSRGPKLHPHQKPVALNRYLLRYAEAKQGDTVLVCHAGSGSEIVAARDMGCRVVAVEIEPTYCATIVNRLKQGVLFGAAVA